MCGWGRSIHPEPKKLTDATPKKKNHLEINRARRSVVVVVVVVVVVESARFSAVGRTPDRRCRLLLPLFCAVLKKCKTFGWLAAPSLE
jgi:hypothetical protein